MSLKGQFDGLVSLLRQACIDLYGERLVSIAVFGSVATGTMRPDSDIDVLLVVEDLPKRRLARVEQFNSVEDALEPAFSEAARHGVHTRLSPIFKTPAELEHGTPLLLDMIDRRLILYDRNAFLANRLSRLAQRLAELGSRRVAYGGGYYWLLKPDYQPGEIIEL